MPEQHPALTTAIGLTSLTYGLIFFSVLAARVLPPHELENQRQGYDLLAICFCSNSAVLYSGLVKRAWAVAAKMQRLSRPAFIRANCITVHTWRPWSSSSVRVPATGRNCTVLENCTAVNYVSSPRIPRHSLFSFFYHLNCFMISNSTDNPRRLRALFNCQ